ncbi:unnamed protein product [Psylliodes chrysocephalus]|uniref:Uncharacterized protein n=1 Tax=Psylliodes chrysocephalus TaxID=3402493 RepID=A0A9P0D6R5_9CUCU|nr:unnamed protein product [Psylliodes chrysocephala]
MTKFRTRLLKSYLRNQNDEGTSEEFNKQRENENKKKQIKKVIGSFEVSKNDFVDLITRFTNGKHLLKPSDLNLNDKMNYKSAEMCSEMVQNLLKTQPDALRTVEYLNLMNKIKMAVLDKNDFIYTRIYCMCDSKTKKKKNVVPRNKSETIRKTTLCWLLDDQCNKLSSDRIIRVKGVPEFSDSKNYKKSTVNLIETDKYYAI